MSIFKKLFIVLLLAGLVAIFYVGSLLKQPLNVSDSGLQLNIDKGATLYRLAHKWQQQNIIPSARLLLLQARYFDLANKIKPGEYEVQKGTTSFELLTLLVSGKSKTYKVSLIEGQTLSDALKRLEQAPKLIQDIQPLTSESVATLLNHQGNPEGLIYPDTYIYRSGDSVSGILKQAASRLDNVLQEEWQTHQQEVENNNEKSLPYKSAYEALIMSSIVEKETGQAIERPEIAGVFIRRLRKNMRLETDPTVIYGAGPEFDGNLTRKHLRDRSNIYNTYRHKGLPPTPIALAGREAINASLNPDDGSTLYFVAKGDGSHYFSTTLKEHNNAVNKYQRFRRAKQYRSAPEEQK